MAKQSKFYQVTNQVLLEYITDQYKITTSRSAVGETYSEFYMYMANDGKQYCIEKQNIPSTKYPDETDSTYYYGGTAITELDLDGKETTDPVYGRNIYINEDNKVGLVIKNNEASELRSSHINRDTIKLYLATGYVMNSISGYGISVKTHINIVSYTDPSTGETTYKRLDDYLYLLDWFMPKESLKDNIHWLNNQLYLNNKFYDRYIEISFPAPLDVALNDRGIDYVYEYYDESTGKTLYFRGVVNKDSVFIIDFNTISPALLNPVDQTQSPYECRFVMDPPKQVSLSQNSNANYFNVRMVEDIDSKSVIYYPVYGDLQNAQDLDRSIMLQIETGTISMYDQADYDSINDGIDDFIEMYGDQVYRWIIINELTVSYIYNPIIDMDPEEGTTKDVVFTEYYTSTIDYSDKTSEHGDFWRSRFVPYIKQRNNMACRSILLSYTAHLFNRMNNIDIIRTGSMTIDAKKYSNTTINTNNIIQYKIFNKISNQQVNMTSSDSGSSSSQIVRSYYDVTNLLAMNTTTGTMYSNGQMTLYLTHTNNNYMIKLYTTNDDNTRVPYDLTGNTDYKLVFPNISGDKIQIFPNKDSENYNLGIGSLIFYITSDKASAIMNVPSSERYFSLMTHIPDNSQEESTLYQGYVEWYS